MLRQLAVAFHPDAKESLLELAPHLREQLHDLSLHDGVPLDASVTHVGSL